jgi:RIO-like serine/threonine protein kinase
MKTRPKIVIEPPNYTEIPNEIFDMVPTLSGNDLKVLCWMCRVTFGIFRRPTEIPFKQIQAKTKIDEPKLTEVLDGLVRRGLIAKKDNEEDATYSLLVG